MNRMKILIVDDDPDIRRGLSVRLRANDYNVVIAQDAITAISTAVKENPDLVLLDIGLPAGDGFLVMERLQANSALARIPVIVVSARDPQANRDKALRAGAKAFFTKPVDNDELLAIIETTLEHQQELSWP